MRRQKKRWKRNNLVSQSKTLSNCQKVRVQISTLVGRFFICFFLVTSKHYLISPKERTEKNYKEEPKEKYRAEKREDFEKDREKRRERKEEKLSASKEDRHDRQYNRVSIFL